MVKYLFILGRNLELSIAEVLSYFERFNNKVKDYSKNKNAILIEVEKKIKKDAIEKFGGVLAIGEIIEDPDKTELYLGTSNKLNYVIWDFSEKTEEFADYLKDRFRSEKLKATRKPLTGVIDAQEGKKFRIAVSNLIDEEYFVFNDSFGKIIQKCNYKEIEKRDMEKPVRRESLSISPRLAKVMINLSQVKKGKLVDPFCGIGVILFESLLQGIPVIGIDLDENALEGAKKNLEWGKFQDYQIVRSDSRKVGIKTSEVIVTEPDLGKILKKSPTDKEAENTLKGFEKLMISVLNNLKRSISGRIVFTSPYILTRNSRKSCNIEDICKRTGLKLVEGPFPEYREGKIVGREIFVLSK
jgi:tRNA G10  N-methylase Trm11